MVIIYFMDSEISCVPSSQEHALPMLVVTFCSHPVGFEKFYVPF